MFTFLWKKSQWSKFSKIIKTDLKVFTTFRSQLAELFLFQPCLLRCLTILILAVAKCIPLFITKNMNSKFSLISQVRSEGKSPKDKRTVQPTHWIISHWLGKNYLELNLLLLLKSLNSILFTRNQSFTFCLMRLL